MNPSNNIRIRFHGAHIGKDCPWKDTVRPLLFLIHHRPDFRARVALLPGLAELASTTGDELKHLLQNPAFIFEALDVIRSLSI
jgi:hypothetical protein